MDSRQLRYFVRVVELRNLTHAAAALHVAQPALSLHMRHLEEDLGVTLLTRSRSGVQPTAHGSLLYEHACNILRQFEQARQEVTSLGKEPYGDVALGVPATVSPVLVRALLDDIRAHMPQVVPHVVEAMSGYLLEWLHAGRLDAAVLFDVQNLAGLRTTVIGAETMSLVGPPQAFRAGQVVAFSDLGRYPLIIPGRLHGIHLMISQAALREGVQLDVRVEVDAVAEMIGLVKEGYGYTMLARMGFHRELEAGTVSVAHLESPALHRTLIGATAQARPVSAATHKVMESVSRILGDFIASEHADAGPAPGPAPAARRRPPRTKPR